MRSMIDKYIYEPESGKFYDKDFNEIGTKLKRGYIVLYIEGKMYYGQTLAYLYQKGHFPKKFLTFRDKNPLNLKWSNIEETSRRTIVRRINFRKSNTSGITGVCFCKQTGKWKVSIYDGKRNLFKGRYIDFEEAVIVRYYAEEELGVLKDNPRTTAVDYLFNDQAYV